MRLDCSGMEFEKLADLLEQGQFELLNLPVGDERKKPSDIRLVYMMNDTAESFLVFHEAVLTGNYLPDYEGELSASLDKEETDNTDAEGEEKGRYILAVHQGDTVCTLFFKDISLECELYDYGEIGHFWVKGYEYLRQLEYTFAILRDKQEYLGEKYCNRREQKLAALADFPPLNYTCYPAISKEYLVERDDAWKPTGQALMVMEELLRESGDKQLLRLVRLYAMFPVKVLARYIAMQLHRTKHQKVIQTLQQQVRQAAKNYPERKFFGKEEKQFREQKKRAQACAKEWEEKGCRTDIFREEPFATSRDSIEGKYYVMVWKKGFWNQKVTIEEIR